MTRLIDADALKDGIDKFIGYLDEDMICRIKVVIDNAPTVELDEGVIQEVLNKRRMTAVANEYLIALHGKRLQGEWVEDIYHRTICNVCGGIRRDNRFDYIFFCNRCGADMRKGATDEP